MPDALVVAYRYINKRERTSLTVRTRLEKVVENQDCTVEEADAAVAELLELGYLDDERYARLFIEDKRNLGGWGVERIQRGLSERGVDRAIVAAALAEIDAEAGVSELDRALEVLRQRYPIPSEDPRERERAFGMLVRRGYDGELAGDAVRAWRRG